MLKWCSLKLVLLMLPALPLVAAAAPGQATVTILEGGATVFHGTSKLAAGTGVRVQPGDLVETGKNAFLRLEFDDGVRLDVGPKSALQLNPPTEFDADRPALYVLSGWIKLAAGDSKRPRACGFATPLFDATEATGTVLAHVEGGAGAMFVEQGQARFTPRHARGPALPALGGGDFVAMGKDGKAVADSRPSSGFVDQMPRPFRDSIPSMLAQYREHEVAAKPLGEFSYNEVESWINAEPSIRRQFVHSWRSKADDPEFRLELTAKLSLHPEWGPILFPELYEPKPAPSATGAPPGADSGTQAEPHAADQAAPQAPPPATGTAPR
jgi:hypothetical protein